MLRNVGPWVNRHSAQSNAAIAVGIEHGRERSVIHRITEPIMKTFAIVLFAALASAASIGSVGSFTIFENDKELAVDLPIMASDIAAVVPYIEMAARQSGLTRVRAYERDVFIPLENATLSFVRSGTSLSLHVEVESEYRFAKGDRKAALEALKNQGSAIFARALALQAAAH